MSPEQPPARGGLQVQPFRALRFASAREARLGLGPAYDQVSDAAARHADEHSILHLTRPADGPDGAARTLRRWLRTDVVREDPTPGLYAYETSLADGATLTGLLAAVGVGEGDGSDGSGSGSDDGSSSSGSGGGGGGSAVRAHEDVYADIVANRLALLEATGVDLEPIYLLHGAAPQTAAAVASALTGEVTSRLTSPRDGRSHRIAAITEPEVIRAVVDELGHRDAVVADGHHRYAASRAHSARRRRDGLGAGPWDSELALLVDVERHRPASLALHRVLPMLPVSRARALAAGVGRVRDVSRVEAVDAVATQAADRGVATVFAFGAGDQCFLLDNLDSERVRRDRRLGRSGVVASLAVTLAHDFLLPAVWGVDGGDRGLRITADADAALQRAAACDGTALLLPPIGVDLVMAVGRSEETMPAKSTFITPKPASGLVMRQADREESTVLS